MIEMAVGANAEWFGLQSGLAAVLFVLTLIATWRMSARLLNFLGYMWLFTQSIFFAQWAANLIVAYMLNEPVAFGEFLMESTLISVAGMTMYFLCLNWARRIEKLQPQKQDLA